MSDQPRVPLLALAFGLLVPPGTAPPPLAAQVTDDSFPIQYVRRVVEERWVHENALADLVPWGRRVDILDLRETTSRFRASRGERSWNAVLGRLEADVVIDSLSRVESLSVRPPALEYRTAYDPDRMRLERVSRLQGRGAVLGLPSSPFRGLWVPLPDTPIEAGATWTDTLHFTAEPGEGLRESYHAVRRHRVLGDTVIGGLPAPWIRTEAEVRYEAALVDARAGMGEARIERTLEGRTVGTMAVDPVTGLRTAGTDTSRWEGRAVLHDAVAGPLTSGVRYEGIHTWIRYDSAGFWAFQDSARAERARASTGMLDLPRSDAQERLRAGDASVADSLVRRLRETLDPEEVLEIRRALTFIRSNGAWSRERQDSLEQAIALEKGDTAGALDVTWRRIGWGSGARLTAGDVRFTIPYLADPERLWRLGEQGVGTYRELARMLLYATPVLRPDSADWGCEPRACRMVAEVADSASEPRLRDAALVGRFARDPARWYPRLLERHEAGSRVVEDAMRLARGVPGEGAPPIPAPGAGWEAWAVWWSSARPFSPGHRDALAVYTARTGRDPLAELEEEWPPADDSTRLALGGMLRELGALPDRSPAELRAEVLSGDEARVRSARESLGRRIREEGRDADREALAPLLGVLLDSIFARGDAPWPPVEGGGLEGRRLLHPDAVGSHGVTGVPVFLLDADVPEAVLAGLPPHVTPISSEAWEARDPRAGGHLFQVQAVREWGPFLDLVWRWTVYDRRDPDEAPRGYGGGGSLELVETEEGWRVVEWGAWIT